MVVVRRCPPDQPAPTPPARPPGPRPRPCSSSSRVLPERLDLLRPSLLAGSARPVVAALTRETTLSRCSAPQERRLAERCCRCSSPERRAACPSSIAAGSTSVGLAPELERHRHRLAQASARIGGVTTQLVERGRSSSTSAPPARAHRRRRGNPPPFPSGPCRAKPCPATKVRLGARRPLPEPARGSLWVPAARNARADTPPGRPRFRAPPCTRRSWSCECGHDRSRGRNRPYEAGHDAFRRRSVTSAEPARRD